MTRLRGRVAADGTFTVERVVVQGTHAFNIEKIHGTIEHLDRERRHMRVLGLDFRVDDSATVETLEA